MKNRGLFAFIIGTILVLSIIVFFISGNNTGFVISDSVERNYDGASTYTLKFLGTEIRPSDVKIVLDFKDNKGLDRDLKVSYFIISSSGKTLVEDNKTFVINGGQESKFYLSFDKSKIENNLVLLLTSTDGYSSQEIKVKLFPSIVTGFSILTSGSYKNLSLALIFISGVVLLVVFRRMYTQRKSKEMNKIVNYGTREVIKLDLS